MADQPPKNAKPLDEIPYEAINDLAKSYETISLRAARRDSRGQIATVYNRVPYKTVELATIDSWLMSKAGGGKYTVWACDPTNPASMLLAFNVPVEGQPRVPLRLDVPEGSGDYQGAPQPPSWAMGAGAAVGYEPPLQGQPYQAQGYPPRDHEQHQPTSPPMGTGHQRFGYRERPAPGATFASDQVLMRQLAEREQEMARLHREREERDRAHANEVKRLQAQVDEIRENARERAHKAEMEALRAEIRSAQNGGGGSSKLDLAGVAAIVASVVPLFTNRQDASVRGLELQQQAIQHQMQIALEQARRPSEMSAVLDKYGPMLFPMLKEVISGAKGSSEREMQFIATVAEQQMANLMGMAQVIREFSPQDEENPITQVVRQGIEGAIAIGSAYLQQRQEEARQLPAHGQVVHEQRVHPQQAPAPQHQQAPRPAAAPAPTAPTPPPGFEAMLGMMPPSFQTPEWRALVLALHSTPPVPVDDIATLFAHHVQHLVVFNLVPPELAQITTDPRGTLTTMLQFMPIGASNRPYADAVVDAVVEKLVSAGIAQGAPTQRARPAPVDAALEPDDGEPDEGEEESDAEDGVQTYA